MSKPKKRKSPSRRATPRWQVIENVVAAIERIRTKIPGMVVTQKAQLPRLSDPSDTRDIDVLVEVPTGSRTLRVAVEVKNKRRPLSIDQLGCIVDLKRDVAVNHFCVVSTSGFTRAARTKAAENNIELADLEEFTHSDFWSYPPFTNFSRTGGQLVHTQLAFTSDVTDRFGGALHEAIQLAGTDAIQIMDATGATTITLFMSAMLHKHLESVHPPYPDGHQLCLRVDLTERKDLRIRVAGSEYPGPAFITTVARIQRTVVQVPERRFRLGDLELVTAELDLFGVPEQVSIARVPLADGTSQLILSRAPARPTITRKD